MHLAQRLSRAAKVVQFTTILQHPKHWHRVSPLSDCTVTHKGVDSLLTL